VTLHRGRFGPFVKHGRENASLRKGQDPERLTLEEAVQLLAERAAKDKAKPRAKSAAKPATAGKSATRSGGKSTSKAGTGRAKGAMKRVASE
jgi:DNA topoisomerase-1